MKKRTLKNYYIHYFFILLIVNFGIDLLYGGPLSWVSVLFAISFTFYFYVFDTLFSIDMPSSIFKYEVLEGVDGKDFLRITIHFDDPDDIGLNRDRDDYVESTPFGLFGIAWGKPRVERRLVRAMLKDLKKDNNEY